MGNSSGISLELVGKSYVFVWECVGNAQGLLGIEWGARSSVDRCIYLCLSFASCKGVGSGGGHGRGRRQVLA